MEKLKVGDRVTANGLANAHFYHERGYNMMDHLIRERITRTMVGTVRRIANNGAIGIEFDDPVVKSSAWRGLSINEQGAWSLHGKGNVGYCIYVKPQFVKTFSKSPSEVATEVRQALVSLGAYDDVVSVL